MTDPRRRIPAVDALVDSEPFGSLLVRYGRAEVVGLVREIQEEVRRDPSAWPGTGDAPPQDAGWYARRAAERLERRGRPALAPVINATGVVLHTNLGRAQLAVEAREAALLAAGYCALEFDLESGVRGSRYDHAVPLLRLLTGAEDALVVNNNAAALVLVLNTLAEGRDAIISRGELVEIGGSFRVPDIMTRSGARMREVGSTNRTHLGDYRDAMGPETALLLKVHRSNFRLEGFTADVTPGELARLAQPEMPFVFDLGSGAILDPTEIGLPPEPTARQALADGADLVTMSGDKLLGGPQAGIILGRGDLVGRLRRNPLCRALRPDKITLAALEATLSLYRDPERAVRRIPTLRMLAATPAELLERAGLLAGRLEDRGVAGAVVETTDTVGGGAYPGTELPGAAVALDGTAEALARRLRAGSPAVVGRIRDDRVELHLRTIAPEEEEALADAVVAALEAIHGA